VYNTLCSIVIVLMLEESKAMPLEA